MHGYVRARHGLGRDHTRGRFSCWRCALALIRFRHGLTCAWTWPVWARGDTHRELLKPPASPSFRRAPLIGESLGSRGGDKVPSSIARQRHANTSKTGLLALGRDRLQRKLAADPEDARKLNDTFRTDLALAEACIRFYEQSADNRE